MTVNLKSCQVVELQKIDKQFSIRSNFASVVSQKFRNASVSQIVDDVTKSGKMLFTAKPKNLKSEAGIPKRLSEVDSDLNPKGNKRQCSGAQDEHPLTCYKCHKSFPTKEEVVMHLKLIHNACATRDCSKISDFKMHSTVCSNRDFGCAVCNKKFTEKSLLLMHFNQHINAAFYICDICRAGFQQRKHLQKHLLEVHGKNATLPVTPSRSKIVYQKCDRCSRYFQLLAEFEEHRSECNSISHLCEICCKVFSTSSRLEKHKYDEHKLLLWGYSAFLNGKKYFCGVCYMGFYNADILKEHLKSHRKVNDHVCEECHSSFPSDEDLQMHYLQHIEEHYVLQDVIKQHSCSSCQQMFRTLEQLKSHVEHKSCKNNFMKTKDSDSSLCSLKDFKYLNGYQENSISESSNLDLHDEKCNKENSNINLNENIKDNVETSSQSHKPIQSADLESMDFHLDDSNIVQNTIENEISDPAFDISDIPVYALKDGGALLNCDDGCCIVVMDLKSYFVLQRGICSSENRMPDIQNAEAYSENDEIDAAVLQNHMLQILAPPVEGVQNPAENTENKKVTEQDLKTVNLHESNSVIDSGTVETSEICFESVEQQQEYNISDSQNSEIVISDNACNLIVPENSVPYIDESVKCNEVASKDKLPGCRAPSSGNKPHICNICQQVFSTRISLCLHMKGSHTGFDCYRCGRSFNSELELIEHEKNIHHDLYLCDLCDDSFTKEYLLKKHKRSVHGGKFFTCELCNKTYVLRNEYDIHMMLHRGETPPTKCDICGKVYGSVSNYMRHRASHEGISPPKKYICCVCDKAFCASNPLRRHVGTHIRKTAYSYECPKCKMCFPPKALATHVDLHHAVS